MASWVLVVDDDTNLLNVLSSRLEMEGYAVTTATDAMQATIQAETLRPKFVLMDMQMPGFGTGADAIRAMRAHPRLKNIPIIIFTGIDLDKVRKMVPPDPRLRYLSKPLNWTEMKRTIDELLSNSAPPDGSPAGAAYPAASASPPPINPPAPADPPVAASSTPAPARTRNILIVEDEETFFQMLADSIDQSDKVYWARNGYEALEQMKTLSPDLMLLDLVMPRMTGIEVLRAMQQLPVKGVPVILMTGTHMVPKQVELMGRDFPNLRYVIEKPCRIQKVKQVVDYLLGRGPAPSKGP